MPHPARLASLLPPPRWGLAALVIFFSLTEALASVNEAEPNGRVGGATLLSVSATERRTVEVDTDGHVAPSANADPAQANRLPPNDEMIGQLGSTRDYDWFYLDVPDDKRPVTPVYFGCDKSRTYHYESPEPLTVADPEQDLSWQIDYYYDADPATPGGVHRQSRYIVPLSYCKRSNGETQGSFRFQMNTERPGRYYLRVFGRYVESKKITDQIEVAGPPDGEGNPTVVKVDRHSYYDVIVTPNADYSLRAYTSRVAGELEPNDGLVEAYGLVSGVAVTTQLSSMTDQDWFYVENSANPSKKISFYFNCKGQNGTAYLLSSYNSLGVLQGAYEVSAAQCNGASGFGFTIDAPETSRYYLVVTSTNTTPETFSQADYAVLAIAGRHADADADQPTRKEGELEPNEKPVDAYPVPKGVGLAAQLSSNTDQDWFAINYVAEANSTGETRIAFACPGADAKALWEVSAFNARNVVQATHTVTAGQCAATGGFAFLVRTPGSGRYLVQINAKANPESFSQSEYIVRWNPVLADEASPGPDAGTGQSRAAGDLEPNDRIADAYPLRRDRIVKAQLGAPSDLDFYYYDADARAEREVVYFRCRAEPNPAAVYRVSTFNPEGVPQNSHVVGTGQCAVPGGFPLDLNTPRAGRYYLRVAGPDDGDAAKFNDADYTLSTFFDAVGEVSNTASGSLLSAKLANGQAPNRDTVAATLRICGGARRGRLRIIGNRLNLPPLDRNAQIQVRIGAWSCTSDPAELYLDRSNGRQTLLYPPPQPPEVNPPAPEPAPETPPEILPIFR